jgi:hypothetical protein
MLSVVRVELVGTLIRKMGSSLGGSVVRQMLQAVRSSSALTCVAVLLSEQLHFS